jgi:hypothetical protein
MLVAMTLKCGLSLSHSLGYIQLLLRAYFMQGIQHCGELNLHIGVLA